MGKGTARPLPAARDLAADIMLGILESRPDVVDPVQRRLDAILPLLSDRRDAALCTELVYGTLRRVIQLQWLLRQFLQQPEKLPQRMHAILLVAAYELVYLDRVPAHATVNWAVSAVRRPFGKGLSQVANAVLRRLSALAPEVRSPDWFTAKVSDGLERMSLAYGLPQWIIELWSRAYPDMAEELARASAQTPWTAVRLNRLHPEFLQVKARLLEQGGQAVAPHTLVFEPGQAPPLREYLEHGALSLQGASSQMLLDALHVEDWEGPIWDACAGRGGKTCAMLESGLDVALASDPNPRIGYLAAETARLGLKTPQVEQSPAQSVIPGFSPRTIVLDAPCSGLGTLARKPDIRLLRRPEHLTGLVLLQRDILESVWPQLAPGGRLVYLTCTLNPDENEGVTTSHAAAVNADVEQCLTVGGEHGADFMFGAILRKR